MASANILMDDKRTRSRRQYPPAQPGYPRGLWGQITSLLFQPGFFFRALGASGGDRQWLWAAALILALIGLSAVRVSSGAVPVPTVPVTDSGPMMGDPALGFSDLGGPPPDIQPGGAEGAGGGDAAAQVTATWTTALVAASGVVLGWLILGALLSEVTLLRGYAPRLGLNLRVAVWASLPLGLMAALQLLYHAAGGAGGSAGLSGMVADLPGYSDLPPFSQALLLSLAGQLTLFGLWSLLLIYKGARHTLNGSWWSSALVVAAWALLLVVLPVMTGAVSAPAPDLAAPYALSPEGPPADGGAPEGIMPADSTTPLAEDMQAEAPAQELAVPDAEGNP